MQLSIHEVHGKLICNGKIVGSGSAAYQYIPYPYSKDINWAVSYVDTMAHIINNLELNTRDEYHNRGELFLRNSKDSNLAENLLIQTLKQVFGKESECSVDVQMEVFVIEKLNPAKTVRIYKNHNQEVQTLKISEDGYNYDELKIDYNSTFDDIKKDFLS